jgi:glycerol-3-phosphate dehydrogenase
MTSTPALATHERSVPSASRAELVALGATPFDVLVIGGGITGAGVARDAALRGLRVALVEQEDFASGTSSRSSRLVHGGVRYLEHGQLALVFESSQERRILLRIAPHLVRPLAFTWPVYAGARVPRWQLAAALTMYDLLALFRNVARHERLSAREVLRYEPLVRQEALRGGARYFDAATDDARLTLATALSARDAGAVLVTHARVEGLLRDGERVVGAQVRDLLGGTVTIAVRARVVVNATGPWSDRVERLAGALAPGVRGSKGSHVAVPRARVGNVAALTLIAPQDGRVMFVLPAGDFTIIGTTDTFESVTPEEVRATETDVRYLLDAANHFFPAARLTRGDVVAAWAGLRPLAVEAPGRAGAESGNASAASREHAITQRMPGLVTVTGGKLTTYRAMAQQVTDVVVKALGRTRRRALTAEQSLPGGAGLDVAREVADAARATGDDAIAQRLVHAHGTRWREVWRLAEEDGTLAQRVDASRPYLLAELRYAAEHEMALTLGDLLIRRVPLAFETHDNGRAAARRILPQVERWLGWDAERSAAAVVGYDTEVGRIFGVDHDSAARA